MISNWNFLFVWFMRGYNHALIHDNGNDIDCILLHWQKKTTLALGWHIKTLGKRIWALFLQSNLYLLGYNIKLSLSWSVILPPALALQTGVLINDWKKKAKLKLDLIPMSWPQFYIQLVFKAPLFITLTISDQKIVSGSLFFQSFSTFSLKKKNYKSHFM